MVLGSGCGGGFVCMRGFSWEREHMRSDRKMVPGLVGRNARDVVRLRRVCFSRSRSKWCVCVACGGCKGDPRCGVPPPICAFLLRAHLQTDGFKTQCPRGFGFLPLQFLFGPVGSKNLPAFLQGMMLLLVNLVVRLLDSLRHFGGIAIWSAPQLLSSGCSDFRTRCERRV